jgi:hypothetical protein
MSNVNDSLPLKKDREFLKSLSDVFCDSQNRRKHRQGEHFSGLTA